MWDDLGGCEHEWGKETKKKRSGGTENSTLGEASGGHAISPEHQKLSITKSFVEASQGQFCRKCTAWSGSLGLEPTPELYIQHIVQVFAEIRRVLRKDGTCWLNISDSYAGSGCGTNDYRTEKSVSISKPALYDGPRPQNKVPIGLKAKDLCMIPARVALALQADGWWLRSDIIWSKPNPMPESVTDRPTRSHEYVFLLTKSAKYFWDAEAVREKAQDWGSRDRSNMRGGTLDPKLKHHGLENGDFAERGRNLRSVWQIATQPLKFAHFASFPEKLASICIRAGSSQKGCCPECGSPWVRIIEKGKPKTRAVKSRIPNGQTKQGNLSTERWDEPIESKTIGWKPGCKCMKKRHPDKEMNGADWLNLADKIAAELKPIPCTVLDPFAGSCRALIVAKKLGRRGIGIDLKGEYLEMPKKELSQEVFEFK